MASQVESLSVKYDDQVSAGAKAAADALTRLGDAAVVTEERVTRSSKSGATLSRQYDESARLAAKLSEVTKKYARELADLEASELSAAEKAKLHTNIVAARDAAIQKTTAAHERWVAGLKASEAATAAQTAGMAAATASAKSWGNAIGLTGQQMGALAPQINDVITQLASGTPVMQVFAQQGGQIAQALGGTAHSASVLLPILLKFGLPLAVIGTGFAAFAQHTGSVREMEHAATLMGGSLGLTAERADQLARSAADAGVVSVSAARGMISEYNKIGKIGPETIQRLIGITRDYAVLTGQDAAEATKELGKLMRDPAKGAAELADRFGLLSGRELNHIQRLSEMGQRTEAQAALTDALSDRIKGAADNTSYWSRKWNDLKTAGSDALDAVGQKLDRFEKGPPRSERIANLLDQLDALRTRVEEEAAVGPVDKSWRPGQSIGEPPPPPTDSNDNLVLLAGDLYQQVAENAAEAWKALGDEVAAANRDASRAAEEIVRAYNPVGEQIRKLQEDAAKLAKGIGPDMSDDARQAAEAIKSSMASAEAFLQNAQAMGLTGDTLKQTRRLAFEGQTIGMTANARARYMAERGAQVDNLGSTAPDPDQAQKVKNAIEQVRIAQAQAAADAIREMGLQADAADRLAEAAGRGEAAQRRANIENQVAAATLNELGLEARMYLEMQEEAARSQIHNEFARTIEAEIAANERLVAGMRQGGAAWRDAETYTKAFAQTLREVPYPKAGEDTATWNKALQDNVALLNDQAKALDSVAFENYGKQLEDQTRLLELQRKLIGASPEQSARLRAESDIDKLLRSQKTTYDALSETDKRRVDDLRAQTAQVYEMETAVQRQQQAWEEVTGMLEKAFDRLGDALVETFVSGGKEAVNWGNITKAIIASLMTDLIKMAAIRPLTNAMFGQNQPTFWDALGGSAANQNAANQNGMGGYTQAGNMASAAYQAYQGGGGMLGSAANWFATSQAGQALGLSAANVGAVGAVGPQIPGAVTLSPAGTSFTGAAGAIGAAAPYGFMGGMIGSYLGNNVFGGNKFAAGATGALAGVGTMAGGTALMGGTAALAAIPVYGWIAAAVIAAVSAILGTSKPSTNYHGAYFQMGTDLQIMSREAGGKTGEGTAAIQKASDAVQQMLAAVMSAGGLKLDAPLWLGTATENNKVSTKIGSWQGEVVSTAEDSGKIAADVLRYLRDAGKISTDDALVERALGNLGDASVETMAKVLELAHNITRGKTALEEFDNSLHKVQLQAAETVLKAMEPLTEQLKLAGQYGFAGEFRDLLTGQVEQMLKDLVSPPQWTQMQVEVAEVTGKIAAMRKVLEEINPTLAKTLDAIETAALDRVYANFRKGFDAQMNAANGKDYLNSLQGVRDNWNAIAIDALMAGKNPNDLYAAQANQILGGLDIDQLVTAVDYFKTLDPVMSGFAEAALRAAHASADLAAAQEKQKEATDALAEKQQALLQAGGTIRDWVDRARATAGAGVSPTDALVQAQNQFGRDLALARSGDVAASQRITGTAERVLSANSDVNGSTLAGTTLREWVLSSLESLPATKSYDQQILEELQRIGGAVNVQAEVDLHRLITEKLQALDPSLWTDIPTENTRVMVEALTRLDPALWTALPTDNQRIMVEALRALDPDEWTLLPENNRRLLVEELTRLDPALWSALPTNNRRVLDEVLVSLAAAGQSFTALPSANQRLIVESLATLAAQNIYFTNVPNPVERVVSEALVSLAAQGKTFTALPTENQRVVTELLMRMQKGQQVAALDFSALPADAARFLTEVGGRYMNDRRVDEYEWAQMTPDQQRLLLETLERYKGAVKVESFAFADLPGDSSRSLTELLTRTLNGEQVPEFAATVLGADGTRTLKEIISRDVTETVTGVAIRDLSQGYQAAALQSASIIINKLDAVGRLIFDAGLNTVRAITKDWGWGANWQLPSAPQVLTTGMANYIARYADVADWWALDPTRNPQAHYHESLTRNEGRIWEGSGWAGYEQGGVIPGYAGGGVVGNGLWGRDSVLARYASGGAIELAGGEGILTAPATAAIGGANMVDWINRNRGLPVSDSLPAPVLRVRSGGGEGAGWREVLAELSRIRTELETSRRENAELIRRQALMEEASMKTQTDTLSRALTSKRSADRAA
jgi:hypothetical protein